MDKWTYAGTSVTDADVFQRLRQILEDESALIVEHRFFRGSRAPHRFISDDPDALGQYLRDCTQPGDSFYFWRFEDCCDVNNVVAHGKVPDAQGRTPEGGAY